MCAGDQAISRAGENAKGRPPPHAVVPFPTATEDGHVSAPALAEVRNRSEFLRLQQSDCV